MRYFEWLKINQPTPDEKVTNSSGNADMRVADVVPRELRVEKQGYLDESRGIDWAEGVKEIRIYKSPAAMVKIIVPDGYRGVLVIEKLPQDGWVQEEVGKRTFVFRAKGRGYVLISATPLLMRYEDDSKLAVYEESGWLVPQGDWRVKPNDTALREAGTDGSGRWLYVIGTEAQRRALEERICPLPREKNGPRRNDDMEFQKVVREAREGTWAR